MIAHAGVAIFVFGNKMQEGKVVPANGVRREFEIARDRGLLLIPIGATGDVAQELWQSIYNDFETYYPNHPELKASFAELNSLSNSAAIIDAVIRIIDSSRGR
jgi:hypothetical protein